MKILLVTLDSKFIHANLAVRYLKKYCSDFDIEIKEFTINQKIEYILGEILAGEADLICLSCYIWNIDYINDISYIIKEARNKRAEYLNIINQGINPIEFFEQEQVLQK